MRPRTVFIKNSGKIYDLLSNETNPVVRFRLAFLNALVLLKYDFDKVCQIFHVAVPTAYVWIRVWNKGGYHGIEHPFHTSDRPAGRPPQLSEADLKRLKQLLKQRNHWETKEIRKLIFDTWGIDFSESQVRRILHDKIKMHYGKPYPHDYRRPANAEEQLKSRLEKAYASLKDKGIQEDKIALGFLDESSPQTTANTVRVWSIGHPEMTKNTTKYKANTIGFYAINGNSVEDSINDSSAKSIKEFLAKIQAANSKYEAIIIVLDNFSSHKAATVIEYAQNHNINLVFLPIYSPDLNPIEFIWKTIKRCVSREFIGSLEHLRQIISKVWNESASKLSFAKAWIETFVSSLLPYRKLCG